MQNDTENHENTKENGSSTESMFKKWKYHNIEFTGVLLVHKHDRSNREALYS